MTSTIVSRHAVQNRLTSKTLLTLLLLIEVEARIFRNGIGICCLNYLPSKISSFASLYVIIKKFSRILYKLASFDINSQVDLHLWLYGFPHQSTNTVTFATCTLERMHPIHVNIFLLSKQSTQILNHIAAVCEMSRLHCLSWWPMPSNKYRTIIALLMMQGNLLHLDLLAYMILHYLAIQWFV